MKEKILRKETIEITTCQETICQNLNNLTTSLNCLAEIDGFALIGDRFDESKANILNAIYVLSTHLVTETNENT